MKKNDQAELKSKTVDDEVSAETNQLQAVLKLATCASAQLISQEEPQDKVGSINRAANEFQKSHDSCGKDHLSCVALSTLCKHGWSGISSKFEDPVDFSVLSQDLLAAARAKAFENKLAQFISVTLWSGVPEGN